MSDKQHNAEALRERLLKRAAADAEFRRRLLAEPKAAVESELGVTLGPGVEIRAVEEAADTIWLVLPAPATVADGTELSDHELQNVAGGNLPGPLPRQVSGFERLSNVIQRRIEPYELTPIQIP